MSDGPFAPQRPARRRAGPTTHARASRWFATAALSLGLTGCSLVGTWKTVAVSPAREQSPFSTVTFGKDHYTATGSDDGVPHTSTGTYAWNGFKLAVIPSDGAQRVYRGRRQLGRKLVLFHGRGERKIKATFEKVRKQ